MQGGGVAGGAAVGDRQGFAAAADLGFLEIADPDDLTLGVVGDLELGQGGAAVGWR